MKLFMRTVRAILGPIILLWDKIFQPAVIQREANVQQTVATEAESLKLYQFLACPFCVKVRRQMKRLDLPIEQRDTRRNEAWREELLQDGGSPRVPCLRIEENEGVRWLYESKAINEYLETRFAA
jgi:glutaredoxin